MTSPIYLCTIPAINPRSEYSLDVIVVSSELSNPSKPLEELNLGFIGPAYKLIKRVAKVMGYILGEAVLHSIEVMAEMQDWNCTESQSLQLSTTESRKNGQFHHWLTFPKFY